MGYATSENVQSMVIDTSGLSDDKLTVIKELIDFLKACACTRAFDVEIHGQVRAIPDLPAGLPQLMVRPDRDMTFVLTARAKH